MGPDSCHHPSSFWTEMMSVLPGLELLFHKLWHICNVHHSRLRCVMFFLSYGTFGKILNEQMSSLAVWLLNSSKMKKNKITSTLVTDYYSLAVFLSTNHTRVQTYPNSFSGGLCAVV